MLLIVFAVLFLVVLFFIKNKILFTNNVKEGSTQTEGLTYKNEVIGDLVSKDTDSDGVPDWEEGLWGTDPAKKQTTPGVPDSVAIKKLKAAQGTSNQTSGSGVNEVGQTPEKITQTDQFSRDLFTTIAASTQNGQPLDQATIDKISSSLSDHIKNSPQRKVFLLSNLKIIRDDSLQAIKNYNSTWNDIHKKYPDNGNVMDVLQKFEGDGNNVNINALAELDPIITRVDKIITELVKMGVPISLSTLHLDVVNALEKLSENVRDVKLYETDSIVALSGMSQYDSNTVLLQTATSNLGAEVDKRLSSSQ